MFVYIDYFIKILCFMGFATGLWIIFSPMFLPALVKSINISRFRPLASTQAAQRKSKNKIILHLEMLIHVSINKTGKGVAQTFLFISFALFAGTIGLLYTKSDSKFIVFIFGLLASVSPYIFLQVKLITMRIQGSYEAPELIPEITNQYKINECNMPTAISKSFKRLNSSPYSKKALFRLSYSLNEYKNEEELEHIIDEFVYSFDTEWAAKLGMNIKIAISDGTDVTQSLDDIIEDLKKINEILEEDRRDNHESFSMIKFFIPGVYLLLIYIAVKYIGFPVSKFLKYQFRTDLGIKFALLTYISMIANFIIYFLTKKPKYDIY